MTRLSLSTTSSSLSVNINIIVVGVVWLSSLFSSTTSSCCLAFQQETQQNSIKIRGRYHGHIPKPPTTAPPLHLLHDKNDDNDDDENNSNFLDMISLPISQQTVGSRSSNVVEYNNNNKKNNKITNPASTQCLKYIQTIGKFCDIMNYETLEEYEEMMYQFQKSRRSYSRKPTTMIEHTNAIESLLQSFVEYQKEALTTPTMAPTKPAATTRQNFNYKGDIHRSENNSNVMIADNVSHCMEFADNDDKKQTASTSVADMANHKIHHRVHPDTTVVDKTRSNRSSSIHRQQRQHQHHVVHPDMTVVDKSRSEMLQAKVRTQKIKFGKARNPRVHFLVPFACLVSSLPQVFG